MQAGESRTWAIHYSNEGVATFRAQQGTRIIEHEGGIFLGIGQPMEVLLEFEDDGQYQVTLTAFDEDSHAQQTLVVNVRDVLPIIQSIEVPSSAYALQDLVVQIEAQPGAPADPIRQGESPAAACAVHWSVCAARGKARVKFLRAFVDTPHPSLSS